MKQQDLEDRLLKFNANIVKLTKLMPGTAASVHLINQIIRSSSAPALMYGEACGSESPQDFIHKMSIGLKELRETKMNLRMILVNDFGPVEMVNLLLDENEQLIKIFWKSIDTAKRNRLNRK